VSSEHIDVAIWNLDKSESWVALKGHTLKGYKWVMSSEDVLFHFLSLVQALNNKGMFGSVVLVVSEDYGDRLNNEFYGSDCRVTIKRRLEDIVYNGECVAVVVEECLHTDTVLILHTPPEDDAKEDTCVVERVDLSDLSDTDLLDVGMALLKGTGDHHED
jgi:hypothetical protein